MRRALILILTLTLFSLGSGFALDGLRMRTAERYQREGAALTALVREERWADARTHARLTHARWQQDERWLKCLISHHHTRAVNAAFLRLDTALAHAWPDEALPALDELHLALTEIGADHLATLGNLL